jgi:hypothetical protein
VNLACDPVALLQHRRELRLHAAQTKPVKLPDEEPKAERAEDVKPVGLVEMWFSAVGSYPEVALAVFVKLDDHVTRQAIAGRVCRKLPILEPAQPAARADPQGPPAIFKEGMDVVGFELRGVLLIADGEFNSIKACQPFLSSEPEITVSGLHDGVDGILRQAVFGQPGRVAEGGDFSLPVKGEGRPAPEREGEEKKTQKANNTFADKICGAHRTEQY